MPQPTTLISKPLKNINNSVVFLDVEIGGHFIGRIKLELFKEVAPDAAERFRQLCTGEKKINNAPVGYKNCAFHRVIRDFMIQGGDIPNVDGSALASVFKGNCAQDKCELKHDRPGLLSMSHGDQTGSQFFITCGECLWLDKKHVVLGQVLDNESMLVVRKIENVTVDGNTSRPKIPVIITECGQL